MFRPQTPRARLLIATVVVGAVVLATVSAGDAMGRKGFQDPERQHRITLVLRGSDAYFVGIPDEEIVRRGHIVCAVLREGGGVEAVLSTLQETPPSPAGDLIDSAISIYCPDFRGALQAFIARQALS